MTDEWAEAPDDAAWSQLTEANIAAVFHPDGTPRVLNVGGESVCIACELNGWQPCAYHRDQVRASQSVGLFQVAPSTFSAYTRPTFDLMASAATYYRDAADSARILAGLTEIPLRLIELDRQRKAELRRERRTRRREIRRWAHQAVRSRR